MSGNSLASLLQRMKQGSVTQGWGAVSVFSRSRLNRLLEQQYIERFNGFSFLPHFSGRSIINDDRYEFVEFRDISLGQPLLSFSNASLIDSAALLTMNVVAGSYKVLRQSVGGEDQVLTTFNISEAQGFTLEMDIDLSLVVGEIDRQGKVTLDLAEAANFRCNLAGNDHAANVKLAGFFKESFETLPPHRSVFQLGMLELKGYSRLNPKSFRILTQAAPGAKARGALNYGDGGVVVAIQLQGNEAPGTFPLSSEFPYLIPDDKSEDGSDSYSATLVLAEAMLPYLEDDRLQLLNNLLFPGQNVFEEGVRHIPHDLAVFGNISPRNTSITLDPTFKTIKAGDTQRFTLRDWKGQEIRGTNWRAVSLVSHTAAGNGSIADGMYTAPSSTLVGHDTEHVVITADYQNAGVTYSASALLRVVFDPMNVAPRINAVAQPAQEETILLNASTIGDAPITWKLIAPEYGTLTQSANRAAFTVGARARTKGLAVQQVEAMGLETRTSSLLLLNAQQLLRVEPAYVPSVKKAAVVQLKDDETLLPQAPRRWKVVGGNGSVDARGQFTASAEGTTASSVVQCEIVCNGVVFSSGYSVIDLSEVDPEPSWKELAQFTIKVPGGLDNDRLGSLYSNGYQQMRTQILVETKPVNGTDYSLSPMEKASMRLVDSNSKAEIHFVDDALDGIPEGDEQVWRTRLIANRFELANPRAFAHDNQLQADVNAISIIDMYLHTRERPNAGTTLHAMFQADSDSNWRASTDKADVNKEIVVTPLPIPNFINDDYTFLRERVDGGSSGGGEENDDDFDFHLRTVDYWTLSYLGRSGGGAAAFETLEFLPVDGKQINTSTIRWESEQLAETMFSWTGYIFQDPQQPPDISKIKFDEDEKNVVKGESLDVEVNPTFFEHGKLVISLHRSDRVPYLRPTDVPRAKLSRDLVVLLIDKRGNPHKRRISFGAPSVPGNRNRIYQSLFTPMP